MASSLKVAALLASGGGSTVAAIREAEVNGELPGIRCGLIISSDPNAGVIKKARKLGIPEKDIVTIVPKEFADGGAFGQAIIDACTERGVDLIGQFGWLPYTPDNVVRAFSGRHVNQHPGALDPAHATMAHPHPDFGGRGMHGLAAIAAAVYFRRMSSRAIPVEATTHHVLAKLDGGDIIARIPMDFDPEESPDDVQKRLLPLEHKLQISVLQHYGRHGRWPQWHREPPLIYDDELPILAKAKEEAIKYVRELEKAA